jgi:LacI family transcriptional regulator
MTQSHRIALLLDSGIGCVRGILHGIRAYASSKPNWVLRNCPPRTHLIAQVRDWQPHAMIAGLVLPKMARAVMSMGVPVVDIAYFLPDLKVPTVDVDHTMVGCLAAEYFLERKFVHFGFFGSESATYSKIQEASFRQRLATAGCSVFPCYGEFLSDLTTPRLWKRSMRNTRRWLHRLGRPAAIFCCDDVPARYLADVCSQIGLRVPDDIALLGLGDDELECRLADPALSSIAVPSQRIGYEAAAILDRLMSGKTCPHEPLLLPPLHVVTRYSTDVIAIDDATIRAALHYIREHAWHDLRIADVAHEIAVGRRPLERRFREVLGRSVLEEIHKVRIQRAKELLSETDLPITTVAARAGFSSIRRLDVLFGRLAGLSPTAYRHQSRPSAGHDRLTIRGGAMVQWPHE